MGTPVWHDDTELMVSGQGSMITDNTFGGAFFGYGIVISNANGFTVLRNTLQDDARFSGVPGPICPKVPENHPPVAFLMNKGSAKGAFQTDFVNGNVQQSQFSTHREAKVANDQSSASCLKVRAEADPTCLSDSAIVQRH